METILTTWQIDFSSSLFLSFMPLVPAGFFLAGIFWLVGFVVNSLLVFLKGGY